MSTTNLPEPYASILASYLSAADLPEIAKRHNLTLMGLVQLLRSEPLVSALEEIEEETRRRNYPEVPDAGVQDRGVERERADCDAAGDGARGGVGAG
jgi:hypothetical protein